MVENKVRSARLSPEIQEKLQAYESVFGWDFGQTVTQLIQYRERIMAAIKGLDVVQDMSGREHLVFWPEGVSGLDVEHVDSDVLALWFLGEANKSVAEGFRSGAEWSAE